MTETDFHPEIQWFLDREKKRNKEATWKIRKRDLQKFNDWLQDRGVDLPDADKGDVDMFLMEKGEKYADATLDSIYYSLSSLYDKLTRFKDFDRNPLEDLSREEYQGNGNGKSDEIVYLEKDEVEAMCEAVEGPNALRDELLIRLLFQTGMRRSELIRIKLEDVDLKNRQITFYSPKAGEEHTVSYRPSLDFLLNQWINGGHRKAKKPSEYLFPTKESEQMGGSQLSKIVKDAAEAAGVQETLYTDAKGIERVKVGVHTLRHSHAVAALKAGVPITAVRDQLNHSDISMTQRYQKIADKDVQEVYDRNWGRWDEDDNESEPQRDFGGRR